MILPPEFFLESKSPKSSKAGNTIAAKIPALKLLPNLPETKPARVGPAEQPRSPAKASIAKSRVPPPLIEAEALLKVAGQSIPTEKPQTAQLISSIAGFCTIEMHNYAAMHKTQLKPMNLFISILWPSLP